jgi:protease II
MRDDFEIPVVIKYDKKHYSEDSPWILFTRGIDSSKWDTNWNRNDLSIMSRGVVCAYPLIRGTRYFDSDWLDQGIAERKLTHFMDLIDTGVFLKERGLTQRLGILGQGESGAMSALTSVF